MLFCGALERSNNAYIDSIVEPCVSKNLRYVGLTGKKVLKNGWGNGKKYPWAESGICVYYVWGKEKKTTVLKFM